MINKGNAVSEKAKIPHISFARLDFVSYFARMFATLALL